MAGTCGRVTDRRIVGEHIHGIFKFVDPPDAAGLQQCIDGLNACSYPWERCVPELDAESNGKVTVIWADAGQGVTGLYYKSWRNPANGEVVHNVIVLNNRYSSTNHTFTMLHEAGHMVDDTALRDDQRKALVAKWHKDLDGRWDGYISNGEEIVWSHNTVHEHAEWNFGWTATVPNEPGYNGYYHKPNEAFADMFVACFAPTLFPYKRFAHWSDDYAACRAIILSLPPQPESPFKYSKFPNDSIYRLYRAYFLREPDQGGYDYWKGQLAAGVKLEVVSNSFAGSAEFVKRYGSLNNWDFVKLVYQNVLGRAADQEGLNHWVNVLNQGYSRGFVMLQFSESTEFINKINKERI